MEQNHKIFNLLKSLKLSDEDSIIKFFPKVRDRDDIFVYKCNRSEILFLSRSDHMDLSHYENQDQLKYWKALDRKQAVLNCLEDNKRRFHEFRDFIANKKWVDIGTGTGGILDLMGPVAKEFYAVEPQEFARKSLEDEGYKVFKSINDISQKNFDVVTLFHVFEHLTNPIESLTTLQDNMADHGTIIIEVPHARDFLISFLDNEAFKNFTFWSEHLILHTRKSLEVFLREANFKNIQIKGIQRYPLANHLFWLAHGKPGGHNHWKCLKESNLDNAYENILSSLDMTDTLIATANK